MRKAKFSVMFVASIALLAIVPGFFTRPPVSPTLPDLPVYLTGAEFEGVGRVEGIDIATGQMWWTETRLTGIAWSPSSYGLGDGVYYIHVSTGQNVGWGINPQDSKVEIYPFRNGWYKVKIEGSQTLGIDFYRTGN